MDVQKFFGYGSEIKKSISARLCYHSSCNPGRRQLAVGENAKQQQMQSVGV